MNRRKGTPCSCECKPCGSKNPIRALNNISPDPNGDFTIKAGNGIGISGGENEITIINQSMASSFIAGDNIEINPSGDDLEIRVKDDISVNDVDVGGDLRVTGDIIQQGSSYETHAEQIYTAKDYIYMREGAISGLSPGDYSGFEVIKYDGTNDGRLVIDNNGVARVGDVGDEQPLLTREESANLTDGALLRWDATNQKAVVEGTVGTDTKPLKSVNGVLTPVTDDLAVNSSVVHKSGNETISDNKTFTGRIQTKANFQSRNTRPTEFVFQEIQFNNRDDLPVAVLRFQEETSGARVMYLGIWDHSINDYKFMMLGSVDW